MKVELTITKKTGAVLYQGVHSISDADSFGNAFRDAYAQMQNVWLQKSTSVGALMEFHDDLLEAMDGVELGLKRL